MMGPIKKCFKVTYPEQRFELESIEGDVVYVRNFPVVYLNTGDEKWKEFTKVYCNIEHPKYNLDKIDSLIQPHMFKIENIDDLNSVPAKIGDMIYRNGDSFMYIKSSTSGLVTYDKILKV